MKISFLIFFSFTLNILFGQVYGTVTDETGEVLPYASIYIKNTSIGTSTNLEGDYLLKIEPGNYELVVQFIGYKTQIHNIILEDKALKLDVSLDTESQILQEVVVAANAEDPAYAIIRKAIEKREYYRTLIDRYQCDVYVKGNNKILDAPEKILGFEVGDLEGLLDSNRQGIVYLSETVSELYFESPDKSKEVVTSSKISGDDQGYSFNSAREMEFDFYANTVELNRRLVSPIANNALNYYRYKLLGKFLDEENRLINKIQVIPRREADPVFYGTIYIVDDLWNIHSLELGVTAKSSQLYFVDSLTFKQVFIPLSTPDKWRIFNNSISFKLSGFGFVFAGSFTAVYSNYKLDPGWEVNPFGRVVHEVMAESNERDSLFWKSIRPMPLTAEEFEDYHVKDSLQTVRNDPAYKDSIDRVRNKVNFGNLLGGYTYQKTKKHVYWSISSPLAAVGFNTVQGFNGDLRIDFRKYFDEKETRRLLLYSNINYGFSEEKLRFNFAAVYRPSRLNSNQYSFAAGSSVNQFNPENPITPFYNSLYSLISRRNYAKYYCKKFAELEVRREVASGVRLITSVKWEERHPLVNNSGYSFFKKDRAYTSNNPLFPGSDEPFFDVHKAFIINIGARIRFGEKYVIYPDRRFSTGNRGPTMNVSYTGAYKIAGTEISFHKLGLSLEDRLDLGVFGSFQYYTNLGVFLDKDNIEFMDYRHFLGTQTFFTPESEYARRFLLLPYYGYSTREEYFQIHLNHNFDGYILDKFPGLSELGFGLVAGAKYLHSSPHPAYFEFHLGVDKIGYKIARLFRVDFILSSAGGDLDFGMRIGLKIN